MSIRLEERRSSPYAERAEREVGRIDRALLATQEFLMRRVPARRLKLQRLAAEVMARERSMQGLDDAGLLAAAAALRPRLLRQGFRDDLVVEAFALAREAAWRRLGKRHYPVQIMGAAAMLNGWVAEMATGEGKTLTAGLTASVAALAGMPVHVVTVNDYLAERDAGLLAPLYGALGLTVACAIHDQSPAERRAAYAADITHISNKEVVFDYLKDGLALGLARTRAGAAVERLRRGGDVLLMRGLGFAIVDEADSVLVDEARTPLIISAETPDIDAARYRRALDVARRFEEAHFVVLAEERTVHLKASGRQALADFLPDDPVWRIARAREQLMEQALSALHLFRRDEHYVIVDGVVQIVDEFTGRIAEGRTWERGLHQMIELKEGLEPTNQRDTLAKLTYQRFFRRYLRLSGMSGTIKELAGEMRAVYALPVVVIPTHRPLRRQALTPQLLPDAASKWARVAEAAREMTQAGRAVLIGTRSVSASEALSAALSALGVDHRVLNARNDKIEAEIVAEAGAPGRITVATNMAGRGTDILLHASVRAAGGLHVILTEFSESKRIDRQLIGRGARQGDPGSWQAIVARDDDLFVRFAPAWMRASAQLAPLVAWCQGAAERVNARSRRRSLAEEQTLRDQLAFAGPSD